MRRAGRGRRRLVEDFPIATDLDAIRKAAGGRARLRRLDNVVLTLDDGLVVEVEILHLPWRWGSLRPFLRCPSCAQRCSVLRRVPAFPFLACRNDLRLDYRAKYRCQVLRRVSCTSILGV